MDSATVYVIVFLLGVVWFLVLGQLLIIQELDKYEKRIENLERERKEHYEQTNIYPR